MIAIQTNSKYEIFLPTIREQAATAPIPATGVWAHIVATADSSATTVWKIYGNGSLQGTMVPQNTAASGNGIGFGDDGVHDGIYRNASISLADCAWWNASLTPVEILELYSGLKRPFQIRPANLIGYWPLDGYGAPALDLGVQKINGVLTGTTFATGPPRITSAPILYSIPDPKAVMAAIAMPTPPPPFTLMPQILW
jgi:hypothetical protein